MAKNFGHGEYTQAELQHEVDRLPVDLPATTDARGQSTIGMIVGLVLCATPFWLIGVVCLIVFGLILLVSPALAATERAGYAAARSESDVVAGCGLVGGIVVSLLIFGVVLALAVPLLSMIEQAGGA